jgi:hypothetical protein
MSDQGQFGPGDRVRLRGVIVHSNGVEVEVICSLGKRVAVYYLGDHGVMVAVIPTNCLEPVE